MMKNLHKIIKEVLLFIKQVEALEEAIKIQEMYHQINITQCLL
jgi:hypothetical protein